MKIEAISNNRKKTEAEFIFFALLILGLFLKFRRLETSIEPLLIRNAISTWASFGVALFLIAPLTLVWRKIRPLICLLFSFGMSALAVTDLLYTRYFSDLFSFVNLGLISQVGEISDSVFALFRFTDIFYFADVLVLIVFLLFCKRTVGLPIFSKVGLKRICFVLLLIAAGGALYGYRVKTYDKKVPRAIFVMWNKPAVCNGIGALPYHVADLRNILTDKFQRGSYDEKTFSEIQARFEKRNLHNDENSPVFGTARGSNLIILQAESLQEFVLNRKINGKEITPNLNKFLKESYVFTRVYNQTASGNSADAEFMTNTGYYPAKTGVAFIRYANNNFNALPSVLRGNGYDAFAMHGDKPGFWNRNAIYPNLGFSRFVSKLQYDADESIGLGLSDKSFFRQSAEMLDKNSKPFYAFMVTLTSHYPFDFAPIFEQTTLDVGEFKDTLMGNYLTSIKYFDEQFGLFIKDLKERNLLDKTLIVVYGDHTAIPRWDKTDMEKLIGRDLTPSWLWCSLQTVPLIIRTPGAKLIGRDDLTPAGLIDVPKTAAALLGYRFDGFGRNLFADKVAMPIIFKNGSYVYETAFAEPSNKAVHDMFDGTELNYSDYEQISAYANELHDDSSYIMEHNLVYQLKISR